MKNLTQNTTIELTAEKIELLEKFDKAKERAEKEKNRAEKVLALIDTVYELRMNNSESVINELNGLAKPKDFTEHFISEVANFKNYCFYDGEKLTTIKENGEISIKKLDFKIFTKIYFCDFSNVLPNATIRYSDSFEGTIEISSSDAFNRVKDAIVKNYASKASKNDETNLLEIFKLGLKIKGLKERNKAIKKAENKKAKK